MVSYETLGKWLDLLINIDYNGRGIIDKLYQAAYERMNMPLVYKAAKEIKESSNKGCIFLVMTGFRVPPLYIQEIDGPLGAASLARALSICLGGRPVVVTEPIKSSLHICKMALRGAGLNVIPFKKLINLRDIKYAASVIGFTLNEEKAQRDAKEILDELNPCAVIAIEKAGRNSKGVYHNMGGFDVSKYHAKVEFIFTEAQKRGILTVGIGDGGNEVGMGVIEDVVRKFVPYGNTCRCPCGGGIAATSKADVVVTAAAADWGGHAVSGMLSKICEKEIGVLSVEQLETMFTLVTSVGAIDGDKGTVERSSETLSIEVHKSVLLLIRQILFHSEYPVAPTSNIV